MEDKLVAISDYLYEMDMDTGKFLAENLDTGKSSIYQQEIDRQIPHII